ncbi:unnamed protein product [Adineta ricciae]|uniref:ADP ribosyltransferase domain-containing protein n=2 Tax=Adineta ricciae TaxID=249248 RepID=A0A814P051_ADIRI|nr:unnamed protein product [Adineta ricciae]CAF1448365.1 unnamed protein product [Adineta ricciae]
MENINNVVSVATDENLETFSLAWLDEEVDSTEENKQIQQQLQQIINHLKTFHDRQQCHDYITSLFPHDRLVLIVSSRCGQELVPQIHSLRQVSAIYVYFIDGQANEQWTKRFIKVQKVATQVKDLIDHIKTNQNNQTKADEPLSINIFNSTGTSDQSTTEINGHFLHSLLLIDVLLRIKPNDKDKHQLITLCREHFHVNDHELGLVREFEQEYSSDKALWWYTRQSFVYKMVNKALRVQNVEVLFLFRFMINDIYQQLKRHQCTSAVHVYRGQMMSRDELEIIQRADGKLISINSFFSTSLNRQKASAFLHRSSDLHRVLFDIHADPGVVMSKPFAEIQKLSISMYEEEVLFMTGCIFRLNKIWRDDDKNMWVIEMQLCGDSEHGLKALFDYNKEEYGGGDGEVDLRSFGVVLRMMGKIVLAAKMLQRHLNELPPNDPSLQRVYWSFGMIMKKKGDYDASLILFKKSLEIYLKTNSSDYVIIGALYNCIGTANWKKKDNERALEYYKKAIALFEEAHAADHSHMAVFYDNIGITYKDQKKYSEALDCYKKSLDIKKKCLPDEHSRMAKSYNNIGCVYSDLRQYDLAMEQFTLALKIQKQSLPREHLDIAKSYNSIGVIHEKKGEWREALANYETVAKIYRSSLSPQHPYVIEVNEDIRRVSSKLK